MELYDNSLQKHIIMNKNNEIKEEIENTEIKCEKCCKCFYSRSNLNKHLKKSCKSIPIHNTSINNFQNINVQNVINNINNTININLNCIKGFDEDWDVSLIDNLKKGEILLSNSKFSKTLENILNNDLNLNVIIEDNEIGIVYKALTNKYLPMKCKDIIDESMKKIYKHLKDFYNDIINNNINDISETALKNELIELENKYKKFFTTDEAKNIVNKCFLSIYNNNKEKSENVYYDMINNSNLEY